MRQFFPEIDALADRCTPEDATERTVPGIPGYLRTAGGADRLYMEEPLTYRMEANGLVLRSLSR